MVSVPGGESIRHYLRPVFGEGPESVGGAGAAAFAAVERIRWRPGEPVQRETVSPDQCRETPVLAGLYQRIVQPRSPFAGVSLDGPTPALMGIVNATPDSFSDGGRDARASLVHARSLDGEGAAILDVGGESTRPGSKPVAADEEMGRVMPVIEGLKEAGVSAVLSVDTRKATVAKAALEAGAGIVNDVSAMAHDAGMAKEIERSGAAVCLMHAQGDPETMQDNPTYEQVSLEVYDWLEARVEAAEAAGISRDRIAVDPGIGFGKTVEHNLAIIRDIGIFHALGCAVVLGASRKGFIGRIVSEPEPRRRVAGSLMVAARAAEAGVQILRVHDVAETAQALAMRTVLRGGGA